MRELWYIALVATALLLPVRGDAIAAPTSDAVHGDYEVVLAGQTGQVLGRAGGPNDFIHTVTIVPGTTTPGAVTLIDGPVSISLMVSGTTTTQPFTVVLDMRAKFGPWKVTTGTNVSVVASGNFQ
jgi:hypothetical protein